MRDIKKCPKCKSTNLRALIGLDGLWNVQCGECGYMMRHGFKSYNVAVIAWNTESVIAWDNGKGGLY